MAQAVKYRPPRRINAVSVTLVALLALGGYLTYQYLPPYLQQQEVYRVLEEHGSKLAGQKVLARDPEKREDSRRKMEAEIRQLGITDPQLETWIELHDGEVRLGAFYSETITWAFDVIGPQSRDYEIEHIVDF